MSEQQVTSTEGSTPAAPAPAASPHVADAGVQIGHRVLSPAVAEKIRGAMKQFAQTEAPAPVTEPTPTAPPPVETPPAPVPGQAPPAAPGEVPQYVIDYAVRVQQAQEKFEKERAEYKPQIERAQLLDSIKGKYQSGDRIAAVKEALAILTDSPADDELYGIVEDYSRQILQIEPTSEQRAQSATAKLRAEVQALKQEQAEKEKRALEEAERKSRQAEEREALDSVGQVLAQSSEQFPYLHALATVPAVGPDGQELERPDHKALVWEEIKAEHARTGQTITVADAAARIEKAVVARLAPFRALLLRELEGQKTEQPRPTSERPRTISSSLASAPAPAPSLPSGRPLTSEERRAQTLARVRQVIRNGG